MRTSFTPPLTEAERTELSNVFSTRMPGFDDANIEAINWAKVGARMMLEGMIGKGEVGRRLDECHCPACRKRRGEA